MTTPAVPEGNRWRIVVNGDVQRWGTPIDADVRAKDVGSGVVPVERIEKPVETLTTTLNRKSNLSATLDIEWENTRVRVPVERR